MWLLLTLYVYHSFIQASTFKINTCWIVKQRMAFCRWILQIMHLPVGYTAVSICVVCNGNRNDIGCCLFEDHGVKPMIHIVIRSGANPVNNDIARLQHTNRISRHFALNCNWLKTPCLHMAFIGKKLSICKLLKIKHENALFASITTKRLVTDVWASLRSASVPR